MADRTNNGGLLSSCLRLVTVEPTLLLFVMADEIQKTTTSALWYDKVCLQLYDDQQSCQQANHTNETSIANHVTKVRCSTIHSLSRPYRAKHSMFMV